MSKWLSKPPTKCDICNDDFEDGFFIDGKTQQGPWGLLCIGCHERHGRGLGTGRGQMYNLKSLEKVGR